MAATIFDYLTQMQPSGAQSLMSALPFYKLPKKQQAFYQPAYDAIDAMGNTDNPLYQKVYGQQKEQGQQNLAESIAELLRQNRMQTGMGRTAALDPERGGETIFRNLVRGYQDVQNKAGEDTRGILSATANARMGMANQQAQLAANKAGIKGNLLGAITKMIGF